jgi:hypothetical protein
MRPAPRVGAGVSPLDDELGLLPGRLSPRLQEQLVRLGTWMPFARAAGELAWLTRVSVSEATAGRLTEAAGAAQVAEQEVEQARIEQQAPPPPRGPAVQLLSADGATVPLVGGVFAEVKTLAIGTVVVSDGTDREREVHATELSYFARLTDAATFTRAALVETQRRGTETAGLVVGVMDGAEWLQTFLDFHRRDAVRVLDFAHAVEYLATAAQATFGPGTAEGAAWLKTHAHELKHGDPAAVLAAVAGLPTARAADPRGAADAVVTTLGYLEKRRAQIEYATFRARGYPIGSGSVESANKLVVAARLKGSGMHWARRHVNPMLALRTIVCSDRWDDAWPTIVTRLRAAARRPRPRPPSPPPAAAADPAPPPTPSATAAPPRPKTIVDGRPTSAHPWTRPFFPKRPKAG